MCIAQTQFFIIYMLRYIINLIYKIKCIIQSYRRVNVIIECNIPASYSLTSFIYVSDKTNFSMFLFDKEQRAPR